MFGRKTIAELKRRVALAESICEELADENCALERENERLREAQILRIAATRAAARLADHQQLKAFHVAVDVAEVVEPRPYVVWDPRTEPRPTSRHGLTADEWNAQYPIGTAVRAWPGSRADPSLNTVTRTPAWTLGDGTPVVSVEGKRGGIGLGWIDPLDEPRPAQGESGLTDTESHVTPCPSCGQPHGDGGVCAPDIKEAA